jgi:hypothetical protein
MEKFALDYNSLVTKIERPKEYRLADVKDRIERVAFDVVRFRDNEDTEQLWRIDERDDGPVIVALYEEGEKTSESSEKKWEVLPDKKASCLHIYYKGDPIVKLATEDIGLPDAELEVIARWLPHRLEEDDRLRQLILDKSGDEELTRKYPELKGSAANLRTVKMAEQIRAAGETDTQ